jgi:hypothetical protein
MAEGGGGLTGEKVTRNGSQVESTLCPELKYKKRLLEKTMRFCAFKILTR